MFFETPIAFRRWLQQHHRTAAELWVGFYKKSTGRPSITWPEAVDEALCFGWIDGVRKSVDADSYMNRFTPRRPKSVWSQVNRKRVEALLAEGRMRPAGLEAWKRRDEGSPGYSFEQRESPQLSPEAEAEFRRNTKAWTFFQAQPPGYRRLMTWYVISAKREETRARRLGTLVDACAKGKRLGEL